LASGYAHRPTSAAALTRAERAGAPVAAGAWALDVGGGPGTHAAQWIRAGLNGLVLDPSGEMCRRALGVSGVPAVRGRSQALPFVAGAFDLVYFHLSIHYGDWRAALDEASRVLSPRGSIEIWTLGRRHHERSNLARWFPSVSSIDADRFPEPTEIVSHLGSRGFEVERTEETETVDRRVGEWVAAVRGGFVSTLQLVSPTELETGLEAFVHLHPDPDASFRYELRYDRVGARRPPLLLPEESGDPME